MDYTRHGHNKPGEWLKYLTTQHDVGIQTNLNYDLAQPHDDSRATEGDFKHQLSCRLCKGYTHGIQCQACLFNYCTFCMGPTGYYCLRSDCISTFQTLDTFAERQKKSPIHGTGSTWTIAQISHRLFGSATPEADSLFQSSTWCTYPSKHHQSKHHDCTDTL